ncbi:MAG: YggS family pyridoxal phosphate-dependent enzyme [Lachnospiraceae bacterium]|nr:YggS family pyridoxal phosphate-dependent enzyme [Candidatus Equihabitans merdae]
MIVENMNRIKKNIEDSCIACGRDPKEAMLLAVSKTKPAEMIQTLYNEGHRDFGENYVQELREKEAILPKDIRWHMIGHLQRNKVKYIAPFVTMIHSVDTEELALTIEKEAAKNDRIIPILLEVNVAGEETKYGLKPEETAALAEFVGTLPHVKYCGLMTSAPFLEDPEDDRIYFRKLKELSVDINNKNIDNINGNVLSMGMSNDYRVAVEEGSTIIRVGTDIFGARNYNK